MGAIAYSRRRTEFFSIICGARTCFRFAANGWRSTNEYGMGSREYWTHAVFHLHVSI